MARLSHTEAREVLCAAFAARGQKPNLAALQVAQAIALFEGNYGDWKARNNWGAVSCGHRAPCGPGCAQTTDHDASGKPYQGCYRIYPTPQAGAEGLLHELLRRPGVGDAMRRGDPGLTAKRMRATGYFEAPEARYADAIRSRAAEIARALDEPLRVQRRRPWIGVALTAAAAAGTWWWLR